MVVRRVRRLWRGLSGRAYEAGLRLKLIGYRKPWMYAQNVEYWDRGYAAGQHDHYASVADCPRYGVLAGYLAAVPGPLRIVDVGCGQGLLRDRIPDQKVLSYLGVDQAQSAIDLASSSPRPNTRFEVASLPSEKDWDVVICNEMLYLTDDVEEFLDKVRTLLRPDGLLLVSMTRFHGDFTIRDILSKKFRMIDECVVINKHKHEKWRLACYKR